MVSLLRRIVGYTHSWGGRRNSRAVVDPFTEAFDTDYFRQKLDDAGIATNASNLTDFYRRNASVRALSPNPWFDESYYRKRNADVAAAIEGGGVLSGFDHFVRYGLDEGRHPNALFERQSVLHGTGKKVDDTRHFDANFYLLTYELARQFIRAFPILDAKKFFETYGWRMGHVPARTERVDAMCASSHQHWLVGTADDIVIFEFDEDYYRHAHRHELGEMTPQSHYLRIGRRLGYSPNASFDEMFYRTFYADIGRAVSAGKISSGFEHYLLAGRKESRLPKFQLAPCIEHTMPGLTQPIGFTNFLNLEKKLLPPQHRVDDELPQRIWFLVPFLNPDIFFGGYSALINLAVAFMRRGYAIGFFLFEESVDSFNYYCYRFPDCELAKRRKEIALHSALSGAPFKLGRDDVLLAYSAWQALAASVYVRSLHYKKFIFLVQEHEAVFHANDSAQFLVNMAYSAPHVALFNSSFLESHFRLNKLGVFQKSETMGSHLTFEHVLTKVSPPSRSEILDSRKRRVVVYTRPEIHAQRNLAEICIIALRKAIAENIFSGEFEFIGIGALSGPHCVDLGWGRTLHVVEKVERDAYVDLIRGADIGLSLMYAPHPSLIPFELANAGAIVVTNTFKNRNADDLSALSPRLVPVDPTIDGIVAGLHKAVQVMRDVDLRTNPDYAVRSPPSWNEVFDDAFVGNLFAKLGDVNNHQYSEHVPPLIDHARFAPDISS